MAWPSVTGLLLLLLLATATLDVSAEGMYKIYIQRMKGGLNQEVRMDCVKPIAPNEVHGKAIKYGRHDNLRTVHQRGLDTMYHEWIKQYPRLVEDPYDADVVYVPFLPNRIQMCGSNDGRWVRLDKKDRHKKIMRDFIRRPERYLPHIESKPHIVVLGQPMPIHVEMKSNMMYTTWPKTGIAWGTMEPTQMNMESASIAGIDAFLTEMKNIVSLPYPSWWHTPFANNTLPGLAPGEKKTFAYQALGLRPKQKRGNRVNRQRKRVIDNCKELEDLGCHVTVMLTSSNPPSDQETIAGLARSHFSMQPQGDTLYRKSFYDSLGSGTIPVIYQNTDFVRRSFPFRKILKEGRGVDVDDFLYYVDATHADANPEENVFAELLKVPDSKLHDALEKLNGVKNAFFYNLEDVRPAYHLVAPEYIGNLMPEDDAFTLGLRCLISAAIDSHEATRPRLDLN